MFYLLPIGVIVAALTSALTWLYLQNRNLHQRIIDLEKNPEYWRIIPEEKLNSLQKQTDTIFGHLEQETDTLITQEKTKIQSFEVAYQEKVNENIRQFQEELTKTATTISQNLTQSIEKTQQENQVFLDSQQKQLVSWQDAVEVEIKNRINSFLENFESNMSAFLVNTQQSSLDSINLEIRSARSLIDSYKAQQLQLIEENIVAVLERTLSIVLKEKLSLKDQMDLIYEALERAKQEKFLV